jgi:predicted ThiF/HesA family dinucleotide-utilizing enzyme
VFATASACSNIRTQRPEVGVVIIADIVTKPSSPFAIENHQLCQSSGIADSFSVIGNGLFGFGDRRVLSAQYVRPKPPIHRLLVRFQDVRPQAKTGVEKHLIISVRSVEILDQTQQSCAIEAREPYL